MIKVLNLYAGIGGNRKLWEDVEVTAVENNTKIAGLYSRFFPKDRVFVCDAHQFLLEHYNEYDFIWASPPCPTHSRMNFLKLVRPQYKKKYPDMRLYQEIIFLQTFFKGKYCVENVISYYDPLIKPQKSNNHYFWCNFQIPNLEKDVRDIRGERGIEYKEKRNMFDLSEFDFLTKGFKDKVLNNCVSPKVGKAIFDAAFKLKQVTLGGFYDTI